MEVYISIGSNLGDRLKNIQTAVRGISKLSEDQSVRVSSIYETEPWGKRDQPFFLNCVASARIDQEPEELLGALQRIEDDLGRDRNVSRWDQRVIDLDILLCGYLAYKTGQLEIPHPELLNRRFVLVPLAEINSEFVIPGKDISIRKALVRCPDNSSVVLFPEKI